jgi:anaerobic selenocysteine-containing dehydrogenase/Fe-S-cluster-containing hydrogenase component 2
VLWFDQQQTGEDQASLDFLTVTCQQCERPACVRACPVNPKAITKDPDTGVVSVDESLCTGCGECAVACPYGAIGYNAEKHHAVKCDLCRDRRANGDEPACATVCPTRAITFGQRDHLLADALQNNRNVLDTDHFLQKPATIYLTRLGDCADQKSDGTNRTSRVKTPALMRDHQVRRVIENHDPGGPYRSTAEQKIDATPTRIVEGGCHICFNACPVQYHVKGEQVINVFGNPKDPVFEGRVCPKSQMTLQSYSSKERLTTPLKRTGKKGAEQFEPISWEQALDEIAAKLSAVRERHGSEALAIHAGSRTGTLNLIGFIPMFAGLWGTPNRASTEPFCDLSKTVAMEMTQGNAMLPNVYTEQDIGSAGLYVYIGDNQAETRPVNFGMVNDWRLKSGARLIVVDPRLTATASKADQWLDIRPGTDMALGLALVHKILTEQWHDVSFCERWITGFEQWRSFIFDQVYSAQWAAQITGLSADSIEALAKEIATADGCMLFLSRGINQHSNSGQTNRVYMFLAAITGNWGRRGGGYFNVNSEVSWVNPPLPPHRVPEQRPAIAKNPAGWVPAMLGDASYPIRALITGNNPLAQWPNKRKTEIAFEQLDLLVHMELYKNATSAYADYVLPMATGIEKGGTSRFAEDRRVLWNDPLIAPPGQAKSDHWFWIELGKRFGFEDVIKEEYKDPALFWDQVLSPATPAVCGITTDYIKSQPAGSARVPLPTADTPDNETLYQEGTTAFGEPKGKRFPTASGTLEFYTTVLNDQFAELGLSALPQFYAEANQLIDVPRLEMAQEPVVSPFLGNTLTSPVKIVESTTDPKLRERFDTHLVTGRPPAPHFHSWTHYFWQAQEMWPELYCQLHPSKAQAIGISDGDTIMIETVLGRLKARAWIHRGIRADSIFIPIGWDEFQPFHPAESVNKLTGVTLDPVSQQANLKSHLCRVTPI